MVDILQAIKDGWEVETQSGRAVRIYATDGFGAYSIHGAYRISEGDWFLYRWDRHGRPFCGNDDMALKAKPNTIELDLWINVYPDGSGTAYQGRDKADLRAALDRVACIHIQQITEGEGL